MKIRTIILASLIPLLVGVGCKKDSTYESNGMGRIEITDAPIDDTNVKAVYVTITAIKVDGKEVENFTPVTIDLKTLHSGKTKLLAETPLELKKYSTVFLVLDYEKDVSGVYPGSYVMDEHGKKHALLTDNNEVQLNYSFTAKSNNVTNLLIDFDLRKAIVRSSIVGDNYDFPNHTQLTSALRIMEKDKTGTLKGNARNLNPNGGKIIVYAYKIGEYNPMAELLPKGYQNIEFSNAATSANLDSDGDFTMVFLEEGEYEIQFAYYKKDKSGEKYVFHGTYNQSYLTTLPNNTIKITSNSVYNVDLFLTGLQLI